MKKIAVVLAMSLLGSGVAHSYSHDDTEYAKKISYCAGIGWASKTYSESIPNPVGEGPSEWEMQFWVATARILTDSNDELLKNEFRNGYKFGDSEIKKLKLKLKHLSNPNSFDGDDLRMKMSTLGTSCVPDTDVAVSTYEKLGEITEKDLINNSIADLKTWL